MNLHVEIRGQGYPLLCLHGHPGSGRSLSVFSDPLCQRFQTIAPDLRGYGKSRTTQPFVMADHLQDLQALLDRLNCDRCLLLGWSLGGILALELALQTPQRFSGLILIATAARPYSRHPPVTNLELAFTGIAGLLNWLKPAWEWNIETFGKRSLFRYLICQHNQSAYQYLASEGVLAYRETSSLASKALSQALRQSYNRLDDLSQLTIPALILAGEQDYHIAASASAETAAHLPDATFHCYKNTAHLFPWEIPHQVQQDIEAWLMARPQIVETVSR
ncbi:MAG: alpha/beta hydrolase [Chloroflexaceae bacterium]|nr:alpha/beta hydrolase [Chloroflexaceae bacterium]